MKTQKERRAESDARIIAAAIKCFGQHGYTNSTMVGIAKEAGVTGGLLAQRYDSKDKLFFEAYIEACSKPFLDRDSEGMAVPFCLIRILDRIKELRAEKKECFDFLNMVLGSTDLPESFIEASREMFLESSFNKALLAAQKEKAITDGDTYNLFVAFYSLAVRQIDICFKYDIPCPEDSFFLEIFRISDTYAIKMERQKENVLKALCKAYQMLTYVYVDDNRAEMIKNENSQIIISNSDDAREGIEIFIRECVKDEYKDNLREFLNMDNLDERIGEKSIVYFEYINLDGKKETHILMPVKRDENGRITEIIGAIHSIEI